MHQLRSEEALTRSTSLARREPPMGDIGCNIVAALPRSRHRCVASVPALSANIVDHDTSAF